MNKKGQSILAEYALIMFIVIGALTAMSMYVQRGFQARIHDARNYMITSASSALANVCLPGDNSCLSAIGNSVPYGYEPYYMISETNQAHNEKDVYGSKSSNYIWGIGVIDIKTVNSSTKSDTASIQMAPQCANGGC